MTSNAWELYSTQPGWEAASGRLDAALAESVTWLHAAVAGGTTLRVAVSRVLAAMERAMRAEAAYGATDIDARALLAGRLNRLLRERYDSALRVNRFGDITKSNE